MLASIYKSISIPDMEKEMLHYDSIGELVLVDTEKHIVGYYRNETLICCCFCYTEIKSYAVIQWKEAKEKLKTVRRLFIPEEVYTVFYGTEQ